MTQSSLFAECRAAMEAGLAAKQQPAAQEEFLVHETLEHAFRLKVKAGALEQDILDRHAALDAELEPLREEIKRLTDAKDRIVLEHVEAGNLNENGYLIKTLLKKENRKPDMEKIRRHEDDWNLLVSLEVKRVKENYIPNQTALKAVFGKQYDAFLIPAQENVTGYDIEPQAQQPEKAAEVEL